MSAPVPARHQRPPLADPREHARRAAEARWGPSRHVNLADCDPALRRLILALIEAAKAASREEEAA